MKNKTDKKGFYCGCATLGDKTIISTNCPVHFEKAEHLFKVKPTDRAKEKCWRCKKEWTGAGHYCPKCCEELSTPEETAHSGLIDTSTAQKRQKVVESKVSDWESYVDKWSKQGRSEEQIWAVRNFMSGQGALMLKDLHDGCIPKKELAEMLKNSIEENDLGMEYIMGKKLKKLKDKLDL